MGQLYVAKQRLPHCAPPIPRQTLEPSATDARTVRRSSHRSQAERAFSLGISVEEVCAGPEIGDRGLMISKRSRGPFGLADVLRFKRDPIAFFRDNALSG